MVILSFFVGSFLDNYEHGTFVMMVLNVMGDIYAIVCYLLFVHFFDTSTCTHLVTWKYKPKDVSLLLQITFHLFAI